jgi:hypothetical protein
VGWAFEDAFQRADGALGAEWDVLAGAGNWSLKGGRIEHVPAANDERVLAVSVPPAPGMDMRATVSSSNPGKLNPGMLVRWDDELGRGYLVDFGGYSNANLEDQYHLDLYRVENGAYTLLERGNVPDVVAGHSYRLRAVVQDGRQRVYHDGVLIIDYNDAVLDGTTGRAGLRTGRSAAGTATYDDVQARGSTPFWGRDPLPFGSRSLVS